jgi:electron transfer flavoprotein beta subunit
MKAKRKPLDVKSADEFGVDLTPRSTLLKVTPPAERQAGIVVETVDELVDKLKNEAKVIA